MKKKILMTSLIVILSLALAASLLIIAFCRYFLNEYGKESEVRSAFEMELSRTEGITLNKEPWLDKSELLIWATIDNEGEAVFWYNKDNSPRLMTIGKYNTDFNCYDANNNLVYTTSMGLSKNHRFKKLFPFEVSTLQDIVNHYDEMMSVMDQLPQKPETALSYTDSYTPPYFFNSSYKETPLTCKLVL